MIQISKTFGDTKLIGELQPEEGSHARVEMTRNHYQSNIYVRRIYNAKQVYQNKSSNTFLEASTPSYDNC